MGGERDAAGAAERDDGRVMRTLTVLYDPVCPVCRRARAWLEGQLQIVPMEFVAAGSPAALARFPALDHGSTLRKITVIGDGGEVYQEERAWLACLWALAEWRPTAIRFSRPGKEKYVLTATRMADRLRAMTRGGDYGGQGGGDPCGGESCQR